MTDTPETDAAYFRYGATMYDLAGTCKRLERERDQLKAINAELLDALKTISVSDWKTAGELRKMARDAHSSANTTTTASKAKEEQS